MPLILGISMHYESFEGTRMQEYAVKGELWGFIGTYIRYGGWCLAG